MHGDDALVPVVITRPMLLLERESAEGPGQGWGVDENESALGLRLALGCSVVLRIRFPWQSVWRSQLSREQRGKR